MKTFFRVLIAVLIAPLWIPVGLVYLVLTSPYWVIGFFIMLGGFVITGEWEFPDIG